jgi:hypothetical protein
VSTGVVTGEAAQPALGGGPALRGRTRKNRDAQDREDDARRWEALYRQIERDAGLNNSGPGASDLGPDDTGASTALRHAYSVPSLAEEDRGVTPDGPDGFSKALLDRLLALPREEIRLPVEPFPHIMSAGRAAAIEAARQHALRLKDDDEAVTALLLSSLF